MHLWNIYRHNHICLLDKPDGLIRLAQYDLNIVPQPGKLNTVADALSRICDYVNQLWHIYHKANVFSVQVITSRELSSRVNETFYVDEDIEAMTSQLNVMSVLTIESSISEKQATPTSGS